MEILCWNTSMESSDYESSAFDLYIFIKVSIFFFFKVFILTHEFIPLKRFCNEEKRVTTVPIF